MTQATPVTPEPRGMGNDPANAPHDVPSVGQLLEAVQEFLQGDVLPATTGRVQFHTRVAINVLAIVQRQLASSADDATSHTEGLAELGFSSDEELARAIRSGALDDRYDAVAAFVRSTVRAKLAVANPAYLPSIP